MHVFTRTLCFALSISSFLLAGCAGSINSGSAATNSVLPAVIGGTRGANTAQGYLYIASFSGRPYNPGAIWVYTSSNPPKLVSTITNGISFPNQIAMDGAGNLYVANGGPFQTANHIPIAVYAPGKSVPEREIDVHTPKGGGAAGLAVARDGTLYASVTTPPMIVVFPPGATKPSAILRAGMLAPGSLALDGKTLYIADNDSGLLRWSPGQSRPVPVYWYMHGATNVPSSVAVGPQGILAIRGYIPQWLELFRKGKVKPYRTFYNLESDGGETFLPNGDIAASSLIDGPSAGYVNVYPPNSVKPRYTIQNSDWYPISIVYSTVPPAPAPSPSPSPAAVRQVLAK